MKRVTKKQKRAYRKRMWRKLSDSQWKAFVVRFERAVNGFSSLDDTDKTAIAMGGLLLLMFGDLVSGQHDIYQHLYYLPVWFAAWFLNRKSTLIMATMITAWLGVQPLFGQATANIPWACGLIVSSAMFFLGGMIFAFLREVYDRERKQARFDLLTGCLNTHGFYECMSAQFASIRESFRPFALVYIDLDHFKQLNDTRGHLEADRALRAVGAILRRQTRGTDTVGRVGGDEFVIMMSATGPDMSFAAAERLQIAIETEMSRRGWPITTSIGCVAFSRIPSTVPVALQIADETMYKAKHGGRASVATAMWPKKRVSVSHAVVEGAEARLIS